MGEVFCGEPYMVACTISSMWYRYTRKRPRSAGDSACPHLQPRLARCYIPIPRQKQLIRRGAKFRPGSPPKLTRLVFIRFPSPSTKLGCRAVQRKPLINRRQMLSNRNREAFIGKWERCHEQTSRRSICQRKSSCQSKSVNY